MTHNVSNSARVHVDFGDGCHADWVMPSTSPAARDPILLAQWLRDIAERITRATPASVTPLQEIRA